VAISVALFDPPSVAVWQHVTFVSYTMGLGGLVAVAVWAYALPPAAPVTMAQAIQSNRYRFVLTSSLLARIQRRTATPPFRLLPRSLADEFDCPAAILPSVGRCNARRSYVGPSAALICVVVALDVSGLAPFCWNRSYPIL
jgi:hypothetical protein